MIEFITIAHAEETNAVAVDEHGDPVVGQEAAATTETSTSHEEVDPGVLGTLGINGQLLIAQLINFAIILFVLWKWVLTPVAKKLQERTERIEKSLNDAGAVEAQRAEFDTWKKEEISKVRGEASEVLNQAKKEAVAVKDEIMSKAKQEQEDLLKRSEQQIAAEKAKMLSEVRSEVAGLVVSTVEKILNKNLDDKIDKKFIEETLNKSN